jgi:hypothetical protein
MENTSVHLRIYQDKPTTLEIRILRFEMELSSEAPLYIS